MTGKEKPFSVKAQAQRGSAVVLSVYRSHTHITITERRDLYSKPRDFFKRLAKPEQAEYFLAKEQRAFMEQSNVYRFDDNDTGQSYVVEFCFDTDDHTRNLIMHKFVTGKFERVNLSE